MGFIDKVKGIFKTKYEKLERSDVVEAIVRLEKQSSDIDRDLIENQKAIDTYLQQGKSTKSKDMRLLLAKKINAKKEEQQRLIARAKYLLYNIGLLQKLKQTIEDNSFVAETSKSSLNNLLSDQKGLAKFLTKSLNIKTQGENILENASETFKEFEEIYEPNKNIYGKNDQDDELLAMFETEEDLHQAEAEEEKPAMEENNDAEHKNE